jgi:hypothetical protein
MYIDISITCPLEEVSGPSPLQVHKKKPNMFLHILLLSLKFSLPFRCPYLTVVQYIFMLFKIRSKCFAYLMVTECGTLIMYGIMYDWRNNLFHPTLPRILFISGRHILYSSFKKLDIYSMLFTLWVNWQLYKTTQSKCTIIL